MAKRNEAKIQFTADCKEFNDQIQKANSAMTELRSELKLNATQMDINGKSIDKLEEKHSILQKQLEASKDKTEALSGKLDAAIRNYGEGSTEVDKYRTQLLNAQTAQMKFEKAVSDCEKEIAEFKSELNATEEASDKTETATERLTKTIDGQKDKLNKLKDEYVEVVLQYGKTSDEAKELADEIEELSEVLRDNQKALGKAEQAADELDKSFDNASKAASDAGDGFTVFKGVVADLAADALQAAVGKLSEFASYLADLPSETMELRQSMSTLTTAFDTQNFSTETATETWKDLYAVFGDDQTAVEAANHIARMSDNQKDLNDWVRISTGLYATYQDAINPAAIAESAKETAACGKITGQFADALNWSSEAATMFASYMSEDVTTAEDAFNVALSECTTEQERQKLITDTLTALYGDAADTYRETASAQIEAKEATAEHMLVENELASSIEPVTTAWQEMKTTLLTAVQPAIEKIADAMGDMLEWMQEHPTAVKAIAAAVAVLAIGLSGLAIAVGIYTAAQWAMNSAILANPITWIAVAIIAAIAAIVAIVVVLIEHWDEIKAKCAEVWESIKATLSQWGEWINTNVVQPVVNFFKSMWESIKNAWDTICNAVQVALLFIGEILSTAFEIITLPWRFIWENCKEYIFAAWEWIKEKVSLALNFVSQIINTAFSAVRDFFSQIWNSCKDTILQAWESIKNAVSQATSSVYLKVLSIWNSVKTVTLTAWNNVKNGIANVWNGIRNTISSGLNSAKSTVTNVLNSIKSKFTSIFDGVKNTVKNAIDKIKSYFNFSWSLPKIKMPHFSISGKFSLDPPSIPKFSVEWYKDGGIFTKPTIFNTAYGLKGVGEAGAEAVLPIDRLEGYISGAIEKAQNVVNLQSLANAIENLAIRPVVVKINDRQFAMATASASDGVNGLRTSFKNRGLIVD